MHTYIVSHRLCRYKSQGLKKKNEFKYHLLTNNNGYINETADTVNETEVFQFRRQYRLTTVILSV